MNIMRECLLVSASPELVRTQDEENSFVSKFGALLDLQKVELITNEFNQALFHLERNGSPKMTFMDLSLQLMKILRK
jgi:DNA polymerase-3 subunit delta'